MVQPELQIMNSQEAGDYLKVSKLFIQTLAKNKKIPATKIGRSWIFTRDSLDRWIRKRLNEDAILESLSLE